jgi:hypothetical protein
MIKPKLLIQFAVIFIGIVAILSMSFYYWNTPRVMASYAPVSISIVQYREADIGEITEQRTQNSKTEYLGNGKYALDVKTSPIHYKDASGNWQNIDNAFNNNVMSQDDVTVSILQSTFNAGQIIEFADEGGYVRLQPMALQWTNDSSMIQEISMPLAVAGVISNPTVNLLASKTSVVGHKGQIYWSNAYGNGIDFKWWCEPSALKKNLIINEFESLPTPEKYILDGENPALVLNLIFAPSKNLEIYIDGALWDTKKMVQTYNTIEFKKNGTMLWGFKPLRYWDSARGHGQSVATLSKSGNSLYISVKVPYEWLRIATYPVFVDTNVDAGVAVSGDDGYAFHDDDVSITENYDFWGTYNSSYSDQMPWARFPSISIPADNTIDSAYVQWYFISDQTGAITAAIHMVDEASPAAPTNYTQFAADPLTTNHTDWALGDWDGFQNCTVTTAIQELYASYAPYSTEAIMARVLIDGAASGTERETWSIDGSSANSPNLHIEYSSAASYNVAVTPDSYDFGTVAVSSVTSTNTSAFSVDNTSTAQSDQTISVTANIWDGGIDWSHSDTAEAGADTAGLKSNRGGTWGTGDVIVKYTSPNYIYENCPAVTDYSFGLRLLAPTSFSDGVQKTITVRISAAAG